MMDDGNQKMWQRMQQLAEQGLTACEAAQQLGVSCGTVRGTARYHGFQFKSVLVRKPLPADDLVARMRLAAPSMTVAEFASVEGLKDHSYIRLKARAAGIEFQPRATLWHKLQLQADEGKTLSEAARAMEISLQAAWNHARRKGIVFAKASGGVRVAA